MMILISDNSCAEEAPSSDVLEKIEDGIKKNAESLRKSFRTSALWVQYMSMIDILRKFERTGKWELHLQSIQAMFPYMAITGQNSYTKSGMLYLQQMSNFRTQHPNVQQHFSEGFHLIRRRPHQ